MKILLTGATGLVGSVLLHDLLAARHEVLVLARGRGDLPAASRVVRILAAQGMDAGLQDVRVLEAGVERLQAELAGWGQPDAVVHAAAAVKFSSSLEELVRSNVEATRELLLALDAHAPASHFHFISTAYVCGDRLGHCREDEGDVGQRFRQPYERSKLTAEAVVRDVCGRAGRPFTMYRPSIIMGSSKNGAAANFNGMAQFLKVLDSLASARRPAGDGTSPLRVPCAARATKNIVAVDWVASSLRRLIEQPRPGTTYHLTHPRPLTHTRLQEVLREVIGCQGIEIGEAAAEPGSTAGARRSVLQEALRRFEPYLWGEPTFDRSHLERDLAGAAEPPPVDRAYLELAIEFGRKVAWSSRPLEACALTERRDLVRGREPCVRS